ncbi:thermostable carboxypeptidase 1 [Sporolactobacillus inulinus]|nr:thermostable carboxypeptidase 1 [Sporolactobacillus inulinus]
MTTNEVVASYKHYVKKIMDFNESIALAEWDLRTGAPKKGVKQRAEVIGTLSEEVFKRSTSDEMKGYIDALTDPTVQEQLSLITKKMIEKSQKEYDHNVSIPAEEYKAYVILQSEAQSVWQEAKAKSDFSMLQPYLEKIVDYKRHFIEYWGIRHNKYDALLDLYEPGLTVKTIDHIFESLRNGLVPLVEAVVASGNQPKKDFLAQPFPVDRQKELCHHLLREIGYDF